MREKVSNGWRSLPRAVRSAVGLLFVGWFLLLLGDRISEFRVYQGASVATYLVAIVSIVLLTGFSGQVSLGHGGLLAIGGYAAALVMADLHWPFWIAFIVAVFAAALIGALLGIAAARLSGPYLAGTTLAFAVGLPSLANQFSFLGGEQGLLFDIGQAPKHFGENFSPYKWLFWVTGVFALLAIWTASNLLRGRHGRIWRAVRSNETAAALAGVNVARSKVLAFTLSAGFAGLAGALLCATVSLVTPGGFSLSLSFAILTGAVIGGVRSIFGAAIGAFVLVVLPMITDALTQTSSEAVATNLPAIITGLLLIGTVVISPGGVAGSIASVQRHLALKRQKG
ncbi:MAG TPA: branched-chain amino acid ABC transporter permease [Candidatus Nanopelagicaceae bacterium]|nr:branched-chain amino acid ABC transporter permease [Candidatus Nanopelagicaceae bacterium]